MKRDPIKTPFLNKHKDSDFADSLAIFKLILRFMNDDSLTGKKEQALGDYIAYKMSATQDAELCFQIDCASPTCQFECREILGGFSKNKKKIGIV